jgi:hypothetical protein
MVSSWLLLVLLGVDLPSPAGGPSALLAGQVVVVRGNVTVRNAPARGGDLRAAAVGTSLYTADVIETGPSSAVRLLMNDKTLIDLGERSRIALQNYAVAWNKRERDVSLRLFVGRVWSRVSSLFGGGSRYEVVGSNAVAGVRGTQFGFEVDENGQESVIVGEGSVVFGPPGAGEPVEAGQQAQMGAGGSVTVGGVSPGQIGGFIASTQGQPPPETGGEPPPPAPTGDADITDAPLPLDPGDPALGPAQGSLRGVIRTEP